MSNNSMRVYCLYYMHLTKYIFLKINSSILICTQCELKHTKLS